MEQEFQNNRDSFEQFVKSNKSEIAKHAPWIGLLSKDTKWQEIQSKVQCAALLTNQCTPAGWYIQPANLNSQIVNEKCEQIIGSYDSQANDIDTLMQEFFYHVLIQDEVYYASVQKNSLNAVNSFVIGRNPEFKQGWTQNELVLILNNNLKIIRKSKLSILELPSQQNLSIEVLYGLMLSYYGQQLIEAVPQIAILAVVLPFVNGLLEIKQKELSDLSPLERKRIKLLEKFKAMKNWEGQIDINDQMSIHQIVDTFKKAVSDKTVGKSIRNKLVKLIKYISDEDFKRSKAYKDICFNIRKDIKEIHLKTTVDYRDYQPMEKLFFVGLSQALNRLPTDISVSNNGTLRNPRLHIVYPFLAKLYPDLDKRDTAKGEELLKEIEFIAYLVQRAKKYGYFVSDWQNNIARQWGVLRNQVIQVNRQLKSNNQQLVQIPPPLQFDLAIDLNPYAHPFAFTYGRVQGYGFQQDYKDSFSWFIEYSNKSELNYFMNLLRNVPQKLDFLSVIPQDIRNTQNSTELLKKLDEFMDALYKSDKQNALIKVMTKYINKRKGQLPQFLQNKVKDIKYVSSMALFNALFDVYPAEEVFFDKVQLELPQKNTDEQQQQQGFNQQKLPEGYGGLNEGKNQYLWGPVNYGGYSKQQRGFGGYGW